jgi:DEAD/DEAH box helicase domain-containing protein
MLRRGEGGVSALALWDTKDRWLYHYDDHTIGLAARHLESADAVVGYSSDKFDCAVVEGLLGRRLALRCSFDIHVELARALAERGYVATKGDCTLERIARRTLGRGKIEHGSHAKQLAMEGQWARLWAYCADDVRLTRDLFLYIAEHGGCTGPTGYISLHMPDWLRKAALET